MPVLSFSKWSPGGNTTLFLPAADVPRVAEAPVAVEAPRAIETPVSRVALDPRVAETTVVRHETADEPEVVVRHEGIDASQVSRLAPSHSLAPDPRFSPASRCGCAARRRSAGGR